LKPYWGKPALRNFRGGRGNVTHGLATICHEVRKDGNNGSPWPTPPRASPLLDPELPDWRSGDQPPQPARLGRVVAQPGCQHLPGIDLYA